MLQLTLSLVDEFHNPVQYAVEAMAEAIRLSHFACDMYHLHLARRTGATLVSLDSTLAQTEGVDIFNQ